MIPAIVILSQFGEKISKACSCFELRMDLVLRAVFFICAMLAILVNRLLPRYIRRKQPNYPPIRNKLLMKSVGELLLDLQQRKLTSEELVSIYIARILEVNPLLNAVVEDRFVAAIKEAQVADQLIATAPNGNLQALYTRYPLLGIPATVKESIGVKGLSFCMGSMHRRQQKRSRNSEVVDLLRDAGCIPLLVSANPEFCLSFETNTKTHGSVSNPYDLYRTSGGSSGGEAALNGSGASLFGIGSDIAGSIRLPALFCGIFGHKPTGGLVSVKGHFPYSSVDSEFPIYLQPGPMTRFARDLPLLLTVMAGKNVDKLKLWDQVPIEDIQIYYSLGFDGLNAWTHPPIDVGIELAIRKAVRYFQKGGLVTQPVKIKSFQRSVEVCAACLFSLRGVPSIITQSSIKKPSTCRIVFELFKCLFFCSKYTKESLVFELLLDLKGFLSKKHIRKWRVELNNVRAELLNILGNKGVLFFPTFHTPAMYKHTSLLNISGVDTMVLFNVLGFPATHVTMGLNKAGLPVGFQVVAAPYQDKLCLQIAAELEDAFGGWIPPLRNEI